MDEKSDFKQIRDSLVKLEDQNVLALLDHLIAEKNDPVTLINELTSGMEMVGGLFKSGEYYLAELIFAGEIFKLSMEKLNPVIKESVTKIESKGIVMMATVSGDIHDLGKNIVINLLESAGFGVIDLGVDVEAEKILSAVQEHKPALLGLSALLTTAFDAMEETISIIHKEGLNDNTKIMIGGSPTSENLRAVINADYFGASAVEAIDIAKQVFDIH